MATFKTTFYDGNYHIVKGLYAWWVYERTSPAKFRLISPPFKSKPKAINWLWDTLQEEHDLSKADDPPSIDGLDI